MTVYSLTLRANQIEALQTHLLHDDGRERVAYLLCRVAEAGMDPWDRQVHMKFLVRQVVPVPENEVVESTPTRVTWTTRSFVKVLKEAERAEQVVAIVHNHPAGFPEFSSQDDANEPDLLQGAINRNGPGTRLLSLIMTPDGRLTSRVWRHPSKTGHDPLAIIRVIGSRFDLHYNERGTAADMHAFHRQALAFGAALNQDLRKLRVCIVGCGGTGSAVAMLLARLGVGQILLIDNDIVDQSNLNRLHGANQADADAMRPKVEVVARAITEQGLGARAAPINAWVADNRCCCSISTACASPSGSAIRGSMSFSVAETVSESSGGRPGFRPRRLASAMPSRVRSEMSRPSKWAIAPNTWNTSSPAAEEESRRSSRLTRWMPRALMASTISRNSLSVRPRRSSRVTHRRSPGRAWARQCRNSDSSY